MEKAKVYFSDFRTVAFGDGLPAKLKKLIKAANIGQIDMDGKFVAIKPDLRTVNNHKNGKIDLYKKIMRKKY